MPSGISGWNFKSISSPKSSVMYFDKSLHAVLASSKLRFATSFSSAFVVLAVSFSHLRFWQSYTDIHVNESNPSIKGGESEIDALFLSAYDFYQSLVSKPTLAYITLILLAHL
jgi:hypothetical protein